MTSRKKLRRARRHTLGLLDEAATALDRDELALARKLLGRAVEQGFMNPRVHVEAAALWQEMGRRAEAEAAVRRALELAPEFAMARELAAELGLAVEAKDAVAPMPSDAPAVSRTARSAAFDVAVALGELRRDGVAVLREMLAHAEAAALAPTGDDDPAWLERRALASELGRLERGVLRASASRDDLLGELYACARELAHAHERALGRDVTFPGAPSRAPAHVERCLWLRSDAGAAYPRRRDLGDRGSFPLRALLAFGPGPIEVVLHDLRPGKPRSRARVVPPGAAAWFAGRERLVEIAGVLGLQPIEWELRAVAGADWSGLLCEWSDVRG